MLVFVCLDDTDRLGGRGTGALAALLMQAIEDYGWGKCQAITRHQLFVHEDIPYTSHNSSMCFTIDMDTIYLNDLIGYAADFLVRESAEGSDPGLCVAMPDNLEKPDLLTAFGLRAKRSVIVKQDAYNLAAQLGVHLSEHGGTGQGVIGALAGVGLRLGGNDGRFRGQLRVEAADGVISAGELRKHPRVDDVRSMDGIVLGDDDMVRLGEKVKTVLLDGKSILPVSPDSTASVRNTRWQTCTKEQYRNY